MLDPATGRPVPQMQMQLATRQFAQLLRHLLKAGGLMTVTAISSCLRSLRNLVRIEKSIGSLR